jgi:hypothetical protein
MVAQGHHLIDQLLLQLGKQWGNYSQAGEIAGRRVPGVLTDSMCRSNRIIAHNVMLLMANDLPLGILQIRPF